MASVPKIMIGTDWERLMIMLSTTFHFVAALFWLLALAVVIRRHEQVRGTTLTGPWTWLCIALGLLGVAELVELGSSHRDSASLIRHAAVVATACPIVAVFGAKRPQARYWPFVVATLWVILILPVFEARLAGRAIPDIRGLRAAFLGTLVIVGLANYIATRFTVPALLATFAQCLLLAQLLGTLSPTIFAMTSLIAACAACAAVICARPRSPSPERTETDRAWLNFRDAYGAVWALRVAQRMNAMAEERDWDGRVHWSTVLGGQEFQRSLHALLRLFVSPHWLARQER